MEMIEYDDFTKYIFNNLKFLIYTDKINKSMQNILFYFI